MQRPREEDEGVTCENLRRIKVELRHCYTELKTRSRSCLPQSMWISTQPEGLELRWWWWDTVEEHVLLL